MAKFLNIITLLLLFFSCKNKTITYSNWNEFNKAQLSNISVENSTTLLDTSEMILFKSDSFIMGNDFAFKNEAPSHKVFLNDFYIDKTEVSNAEFNKFIRATNYITTAQKNYIVDKDYFEAGALVFQEQENNWWRFEKKTNWENHTNNSLPVVYVSWYDANTYCQWKNKRLPTEAEWEFVAKKIYSKQKNSNTWQGNFPIKNDENDGFYSTAPVFSFKADSINIYNFFGNVWEWCADDYIEDYYSISPIKNPLNTSNTFSEKVMRGGSFLCNDSYCYGYRPTARMFATPNSGFEHVGFRCVCEVSK